MRDIDHQVLAIILGYASSHNGGNIIRFHYAFVLADLDHVITEYALKKSLKRIEDAGYLKRLRFAHDNMPHEFQILKRPVYDQG